MPPNPIRTTVSFRLYPVDPTRSSGPNPPPIRVAVTLKLAFDSQARLSDAAASLGDDVITVD